jgi:hypothetical protein
MRNIPDRSYRENITHILRSMPSFPKNLAANGIMWKNMSKPNWPSITI